MGRGGRGGRGQGDGRGGLVLGRGGGGGLDVWRGGGAWPGRANAPSFYGARPTPAPAPTAANCSQQREPVCGQSARACAARAPSHARVPCVVAQWEHRSEGERTAQWAERGRMWRAKAGARSDEGGRESGLERRATQRTDSDCERSSAWAYIGHTLWYVVGGAVSQQPGRRRTGRWPGSMGVTRIR